jgi:hypothetical protein
MHQNHQMTKRDLVVKVLLGNVVAVEVVQRVEVQVDHKVEAGHVVEVKIIKEREEEHQEVIVEVEAEVYHHIITKREIDLEVGDIQVQGFVVQLCGLTVKESKSWKSCRCVWIEFRYKREAIRRSIWKIWKD